MRLIPQTIDELRAAGKHAGTFIAGGISFAVAIHFISAPDASSLTGDVNTVIDGANTVIDGLKKIAIGVGGISATALTVYNAWRAAKNASPEHQTAAVAAMPDRMVVKIDPATPVASALKVAQLTEVKAVITNDDVAKNTPQVAKIVGPTESAAAAEGSVRSSTTGTVAKG